MRVLIFVCFCDILCQFCFFAYICLQVDAGKIMYVQWDITSLSATDR